MSATRSCAFSTCVRWRQGGRGDGEWVGGWIAMWACIFLSTAMRWRQRSPCVRLCLHLSPQHSRLSKPTPGAQDCIRDRTCTSSPAAISACSFSRASPLCMRYSSHTLPSAVQAGVGGQGVSERCGGNWYTRCWCWCRCQPASGVPAAVDGLQPFSSPACLPAPPLHPHPHSPSALTNGAADDLQGQDGEGLLNLRRGGKRAGSVLTHYRRALRPTPTGG